VLINQEVSYVANSGPNVVVRPFTNPPPRCSPDEGTSFDCSIWIAEGYVTYPIKEGFTVNVGKNGCWVADETSNDFGQTNTSPGATAHSLNACGLPSH
jgi:hypothetical protein